LPLIVNTNGRPVFFIFFIKSDEFRLKVVSEWISCVTSIMTSF
jgi:hypothetical protein